MGKLSNKQRVFVEEYLSCWNASEAARRAGYRGRPDVAGARLIGKDSIKGLIQRRISETAMTADEVLHRLAEHGRSDIGEIMTEAGTLDLAKAKAEGKTRLIKAITESDKGLRVELYDAQAALVQLGRAHSLFTDKTDTTLRAEVRVVKKLGNVSLDDI